MHTERIEMKIIVIYGQYKEIKVYNYFQVSAKMLINAVHSISFMF